jgi:drug/metabolite transporter (DMT)-like permease
LTRPHISGDSGDVIGSLVMSLAAPAMHSGLPLSVVLVVLLAAVAHATWNSIAHGIDDKLISFALLGIGGALCAVPIILFSASPASRSFPFLFTSAALHIVYYLLLMRCYRIGEFSQVYPVARGTSPLVVTILSAIFVGETPSAGEIAGVLTISFGLGCLVFIGRHPDRRALLAAFATGLAIAAYTTVDGIGIRRSGGTGGYTGWLMLLESLALPMATIFLRRGTFLGQIKPVWWRGMIGGAVSVVAYGLVLWSQTRGALAPIAALRETSIIVGAVIGTVFFHEQFGRSRTVATVLVVCGILLLNLT